MNKTLLLVLLAACGTKNSSAPTVGSAHQGSALANTAAEPNKAACLPPKGLYDALSFGRENADLVICSHRFDHRSGAVVEEIPGCWRVDGATAALTERTASAIAGDGVNLPADATCHAGLCWANASADGKQAVMFAMHADGKRAAVLVGATVSIIDVASKKPTRTIDVGQGVESMWFVGETVFVRTSDLNMHASLSRYSTSAGTLVSDPEPLDGAPAISGDSVTVTKGRSERGVTGLVVFDGVSRAGKTFAPREPSPPTQDSSRDTSQHFVPDGTGFIGLDNLSSDQHDLVRLDATLHEVSRTPIATCTVDQIREAAAAPSAPH